MSLATIKTQLATVLDGITSMDTDHVFIDEPDTAPTVEQMPCVLVTLPRITASVPHAGTVRTVYHFEIKYLYQPFETTIPTKATPGIDAYLSDVWTALFGALTLSTNAVAQDFDGDVTRPTVQFRGAIYWGINVPWQVTEQVSATITA